MDTAARARQLAELGIEVRYTPPEPVDEPDEPDEVSAALLEAIDALTDRSGGGVWDERKFNPEELRDPHGRWTKSIGGRIQKALHEWAKGNGPDDPFVVDGKPIDREALRKVAVARGITLKRGATRDEIVAALKQDMRQSLAGAKKPSRADVTFNLTGPGRKNVTAVVYQSAPDPKAMREVEVENRIRAAYVKHKLPGGYAPLTGVRQDLADVPRAEQDAVLRKIATEPGTQVIPWDNRKALGPEDHAAALNFGGDANHVIRFEDPSPRPLPTGKLTLRRETLPGHPDRQPITSQPDLAAFEAWANANGEPGLARWARGEIDKTGAKTPAKKASVSAAKVGIPSYSPPSTLTAGERDRAARLVRRDPQIFATVHDRPSNISTSGNLSNGDAAWLQSIYEREPAFVNHLAQTEQINRRLREDAKKAGETPTVYKAKIAARLKEVVADKPVAVRVTDEGLAGILAGGRFKTSFDKGVKRAPGLHVDVAHRRLGEQVNGIAPDTPPEQRPVYGYVAINGIEPALFEGKKIPLINQREGQQDVLSAYGKVQVVLKPDVRHRTSVTVGDSLDEIGFMRPSPIDNPSAESVGFRDHERLTQPGFTRTGYVEAQIHGGLSSSDIAEVVFPADPSPEMAAQLRERGIPWQVLRPGDKPIAAPGKASPAKVAFDPAHVHAELATAKTREEGAAALEGLSMAQLHDVAKGLDVSGRGLNKADLQREIVDATVGTRVDAASIREGRLSGSKLASPAKVAQAAVKSPAEELASLPPGLTTVQKRAALRQRGLSKEQIDGLVPLEKATKAAAAPKSAAEIESIAYGVDDASTQAEAETLLAGMGPVELGKVGKVLGIRFPVSMKSADQRRVHILKSVSVYGNAGFQYQESSANRSRVLALLGVTRAVGHDVTPGHDELHHYWTRGPGLAKWAQSPKPWTTLVAHLTKYVGPEKAKIYASRWFIEVFHFAAGSDLNRVTHGHPPRGHRVGPG